jgi:hypothetical protein
MPNYLNSKIYQIIPVCGGGVYIGSTTRPLSERMNEHRCRAKQNKICSSKKIFDEYGMDNCRIELIENYPCNSKEELEKREGEIQRQRACVNTAVAKQTKSEYWRNEEYKNNKKIYMRIKRLFVKELSNYNV